MLAILAILLLPGLILVLLLRSRSLAASQLFNHLPALLTGSLILSLIVISFSVALITVAGLPLARVFEVAAVLCAVTFAALWRICEKTGAAAARLTLEPAMMAVAIAITIIMLANGGLLERLADSWWHIALANKMALSGSIWLDLHHVTGEETDGLIYPPLWHGLLAAVHTRFDVDLARIWNAATVITGFFACLAYYTLARCLGVGRSVALLSVVLFFLLIGGLNSYFRLNAWPANVAYVIWYGTLGAFFRLLDIGVPRWKVALMLILPLATIVAIHASDVAWVFGSILFYGLGLSVWRHAAGPSPANEVMRSDHRLLAAPVMWICAVIFTAYFARLLFEGSDWPLDQDRALILGAGMLCLAMALLAYLKLTERRTASPGYRWLLPGFVLMVAILLIDWRHLAALFQPRLEVFWNEAAVQRPQIVSTWFGELRIAHWNHQLREAMLPVGLFATLASVYLVRAAPGRAGLFLAANALLAFFVLISPVLYTFILQLSHYQSSYRIHYLIYHPIIIATLVVWLVKVAAGKQGASPLSGEAAP